MRADAYIRDQTDAYRRVVNLQRQGERALELLKTAEGELADVYAENARISFRLWWREMLDESGLREFRCEACGEDVAAKDWYRHKLERHPEVTR